MFLAKKLVEVARAHSDGQRSRSGQVLLSLSLEQVHGVARLLIMSGCNSRASSIQVYRLVLRFSPVDSRCSRLLLDLHAIAALCWCAIVEGNMCLIERFQRVCAAPSRLIIGLMSGMSMDGVDVALARIGGEFPSLDIELLDSGFHEYGEDLRGRLRRAVRGSVVDICRLDAEVGTLFAEAVKSFLAKRGMRASEVDAVGSHGQTLAHLPPLIAGGCGSTLQVGSGSVIAEETGILTVFNFRTRDMAVGGQGAPLVPVLDYYLFGQRGEVVAVNNLGSIANVTVVGGDYRELLAFDMGPANMAIDHFAAQVPGNESGIDKDGRYSEGGSVIEELVEELTANSFFAQSPPKSAGYGEFGPKVLATHASRFPQARAVDLVRTGVEFCARTVSDAYERFVLPKRADLRRALFSGGGVHNPTLMRCITERLSKLGVQVEILGGGGALADAKEALAMAVLASETLSGRRIDLRGVTGARRPVVLGEIAL